MGIYKNTKTISRTSLIIILSMTIVITLSGCSISDFLDFQDADNTVSGTVELSDRISEEAKNGLEEIVLFVEGTSEDEIKNITGNMGLFWGEPTEYTIIKALPEKDTLKVKFYIEKSNNYYVIKNYLDGEAIPEDNSEAAAIADELDEAMTDIISESMTDYEKELAIHDWLVESIEYDEDIDPSSTKNGSFGALVQGKTMCRGYAEAMKLISECCELETKLIVGNAIDQSGNEVGHAWNLVNLNDKWYHLDVTYDDPIGDDSKNNHYYYFNLNDTDMSKDHTWEKDYFPVCQNDSYMYYKKNNLYYSNYDDFKSEVSDSIRYDKPDYLEVLLDADNIYESQLNFIFNAGSVSSFRWSSHSQNPIIVTIMPNYH